VVLHGLSATLLDGMLVPTGKVVGGCAGEGVYCACGWLFVPALSLTLSLLDSIG
jgi:hypothetical protein